MVRRLKMTECEWFGEEVSLGYCKSFSLGEGCEDLHKCWSKKDLENLEEDEVYIDDEDIEELISNNPKKG